MKVIGLIGGMSWESTATYYRLINEGVKSRLGGHHSAKLVLYSMDFAEVETLQQLGRWKEAGEMMASAARSLERAGAQFIVLCTNTMHEVAAAIEAAVAIPLLHIADPTAEAVKAAGLTSIGLMGTRFTMERPFYIERLRRHGLSVVVPELDDRNTTHRIIFDELVHGRIENESRAAYLQIIERLQHGGAQGVILGCTEISLLISPGMIKNPSFDTTELHAYAAVALALSE
ncbi:MAG TPA: aspartate/glutamate racemase family protein [Steroidobacteraceae bacterium]|nr:aspartate/glutamate racemase family protein [Steroidobacteraceae bacterium]